MLSKALLRRYDPDFEEREDEGGSNVPPPSSGPPCVGRPRALRYHFLEIGSASLSSWLVRAGRSAPPLLLGASPEYDLGFLDFASFGAWASGLADFSVHRKSSSRPFASALLAPTRTHEPP